MGYDSVIPTPEFGFGLSENRLVHVSRTANGLMRRRPHRTTAHIAQIAERTPIVARRIFAPARQGDVIPATHTAARRTDLHMIATVGEQMDLWQHPNGVGDDAQGRFGSMALVSFRTGLFGFGNCRRGTLLQQQPVRLQHRVGKETTMHRRTMQHMQIGEQRHALVVRHP